MHSTQKISAIVLCLILSQLVFQAAAMAHNKVVVIPLSGKKTQENVISVAKENGDFTDPIAAINSFSDESANNRYLIIIGPGVYRLNETLVMRPYIDIVGSGSLISRLQGFISSSSISGLFSTLQGADDSSVGNLKVENYCGENKYCSGISNDDASPVLFNMRVNVYGSNVQYGIRNINSSSPLLSNVNIDIQGNNGDESIGVYSLHNSSPTLNNMHVSIYGAAFNVGIYTSSSSSADISHSTIYLMQSDVSNNGVITNISSTSVITDTTIMVGTGSSNIGVRNSNGSSSILLNADIYAYSNPSYGLVNSAADSYAIIRNSSVVGETLSINADFGSDAKETRIVDSELTGSVYGDPKCWSVTSGAATLDIDCR